jgi:Aldo/keto reductase family
MKTNVLGNSDLAITPVGFGAWAIGGDWEFGWGAQDDTQSVAAIHRALELGLNWIDTAAVADCACEAISGSGIGVGTGFVGLGFDVAAEDCWAPAVLPLKIQQNVMNKPIRITRRIRAKSELFWTSWAIEDRTSRCRILHREWQV